jgi:4'-phosphopantetheinyl transferase
LAKIQIQWLDNITWQNGGSTEFELKETVADVWRVKISANLWGIDNFLPTLTAEEISRANKYFRVKDRERFIISRGVLRYLLGKYLNKTPTSITFDLSENKKPYIANAGNATIHYNLSHSEDWILIAFSTAEIGADVEFINSIYKYEEILEDNFGKSEISYIKQDDSLNRFFLLWTRKEALTKATGKGLDDDLKLIPCLDGTHSAASGITGSNRNFSVSSFKVDEHYMATIASADLYCEFKFWDVKFS